MPLPPSPMNRVRKKSPSPAAAVRKKITSNKTDGMKSTPSMSKKSENMKSVPSISNKSDGMKSTPRLVRKNQPPAAPKQSNVKFKTDAGTPSTTGSKWAVKSTLDVPDEPTMTRKIMKTIRKMSSAVVSPLDLRSSPAPPSSASAVQHAPKAEQQYSAEELAEFKQVFALFDADGSGAIGTNELGDAMRQMGMNPTERELENLIKEVDVDGNGEIDFDEFCMVLRRMTSKKESDEEVIRSCFAVFDQDRNGIISEEEFRLIFREIGKFPERNIDMIFKEADVDGNGHIDYDEFAQMVRNYLLDPEENGETSSTHSNK